MAFSDRLVLCFECWISPPFMTILRGLIILYQLQGCVHSRRIIGEPWMSKRFLTAQPSLRINFQQGLHNISGLLRDMTPTDSLHRLSCSFPQPFVPFLVRQVAWERVATGEQEEENNSQGPAVGLRRVGGGVLLVAGKHLGSHVGRGACVGLQYPTKAPDLGKAKVGKFDQASCSWPGEKEILQLQISMTNVEAVKVSHTVNHL